MPTPKNHRPPPPSISGVARAYGIGRETVRRWQAEGLDLADTRALQDRVKGMVNRASSPDLAARKKEKLEVEIARLRHQLAVDEKRFVDAAAVQSTGYTVGLLVRQAMQKLEVDLPPQLAGHDAARIHQILKKVFREVLTDVSERSAASSIKLIE